MDTNGRRRKRATTFRRAGWLAVASMVGLALAGPSAGIASASVVYATVTGYAPGTSANNHENTWGSDCTKSENPGGSTYLLTQNYAKVIVKAGSDVSTDGHANTIFDNPLAGQTVWADSNGSGAFDATPDPADKEISHIIFCGPTTTTTSSSSESTQSTDTTTTGTTTTGTQSTDTTTTGTTTTGTTTTGTGQKVTLCHRTNSVTNPYELITVDVSAADGGLVDNGNGDHTTHLGPVFDFGNPPPPPHNGDQWGDIIPPFGSYLGLNWDAAGQAIWSNGCQGPTTTTSTTTTGTTTTGTTTTGTTTTGTTTTGTTTTGTTTTGTTTTVTTATTAVSSSVLAVTATPKHTSGVEAATGKPRVTPPPTDTLPTSGTPTGDTWRFVLLGLAALLASLLILSPRETSPERRRS